MNIVSLDTASAATNLPYDAAGSLIPARAIPRTAGFGGAAHAADPRRAAVVEAGTIPRSSDGYRSVAEGHARNSPGTGRRHPAHRAGASGRSRRWCWTGPGAWRRTGSSGAGRAAGGPLAGGRPGGARFAGRALWASHCIDCHGSQARGSDTGPNIIRARVTNFDRSAVEAGSVLGPFLKAGHPTQSQKPSASFTSEEVVALANFLRQRVNDTMRGSALFTAGDIVVGNPQTGEAYFKGEGGCAACHNATTRNLAGIATRIPEPVDLQQRMLFPFTGGRGRGARGGPPGAAPNVAPPVGGGPAGAERLRHDRRRHLLTGTPSR